MTTYDNSTNTPAFAPLDVDFGDTLDDVVQPTLEEHPYLQYLKGNLSTLDRKVPVGWHVRVGVNPELDKLLTRRGTEQYVVQHKTGDVRQVPYWNLNGNGLPCSLIIVGYGVKSPWQMKRNLDDRAGVAYGVGLAKDDEGNILYKENSDKPKQRPQLQFRAFVHELVGTNEQPDDGFNDWFQVSLSNYIVDDMFAVLNAQYPVVDAYNASMLAQGKPNRAKYWGFSIPTVPSVHGKDVGPDENHQSTIYPMVHAVPQLRPGTAETTAYLNAHRIPLHIQQQLLQGLLDETLIWSIQRSQEIVYGKQDQGLLTTVTEDPIDVVPVELPPFPSGADPLVNEDQVTWIRDTYCGQNQGTVTAICQHFQVSDLAQVRVSQYTLLYDQVNK